MKIVVASRRAFRHTLFMVDGDTNKGGNVTNDYPCDVCNESPAMTWLDDAGAVCYDCRSKVEKESDGK